MEEIVIRDGKKYIREVCGTTFFSGRTWEIAKLIEINEQYANNL